MALSEFELRRCEKVLASYRDEIRPRPDIRDQLDFGYRIKDQSVELFEIRPAWRSPGEMIEHPVFKATYVKSKHHWKLYWMRGNLKWYRYDPHPIARTLEEIIDVVRKDEWACFYG
jgi:hypothetical protein